MGRRIQLGALSPLSPEEEAAVLKGSAAEVIFFEAARRINHHEIGPRRRKPGWLAWIDKADPIQDFFMGIDAIAYTDAGEFYVQIKSSEKGYQKFLRKLASGRYGNKPFIIITIHEGVEVEEVIDAFLWALDELYGMVSR